MRSIWEAGLMLLAIAFVSAASAQSWDEGQEWAEQNDPTSYSECEDEFDGSEAEDACREHVEENYGGSFQGYDCTEDCAGHEAGYQWAEDNGIDDPDDCGGNSTSFVEGCRAYAEEN